jgi:hypothetical protein
MGNGLGIKEKDLHGLSGSGFRSEIILANININTEVDYFRTIRHTGAALSSSSSSSSGL